MTVARLVDEATGQRGSKHDFPRPSYGSEEASMRCVRQGDPAQGRAWSGELAWCNITIGGLHYCCCLLEEEELLIPRESSVRRLSHRGKDFCIHYCTASSLSTQLYMPDDISP